MSRRVTKSGPRSRPARVRSSSDLSRARASSGLSCCPWAEESQYSARARSASRAELAEHACRLRRRTNRLGRTVEAAEHLGDGRLQLRPDAALLRRLEKALVSGQRRRPFARREREVGFEPGPRRVRVRDDLRRRLSEAWREEVEGGHRRLRDAVLEGADVGLRVALAGELLLGQSGRQPGLTEPLADRVGQRAVIDDDATSGLTVPCPGLYTGCHLFVDSLEKTRRGLEAIGEERERGDRRHRRAPLDSRHERARERRPERGLSEIPRHPSPAELAPDGDAQRRRRAGARRCL